MNSRLCKLISMNEIHIFSSLLITFLNFDFYLSPIFFKTFSCVVTKYVSVSFFIQISASHISVKIH